MIRAILTIALFAGFAARGTNVSFNLNDPTLGVSQTTNVEIVLQAEGVNFNGGVTLLPITLYGWTDTNGQYTFTNVQGSATTGFYRWTVPANSNPAGNGPASTSSGDIQVTSTNLGTVANTTIAVVFGTHTYPSGSSWTWSAQAADLRYSQSSNNLANYALIGQLNSTSNSIVAMIPSTNGFLTASDLGSAAFVSTNRFDVLGAGSNAVLAAGVLAAGHELIDLYSNVSVDYNNRNLQTSAGEPVLDWLHQWLEDTTGSPTLNWNTKTFLVPWNGANLTNISQSSVVGLITTNAIMVIATNAADAVYSNNPAGYLTTTATNAAASTNYVIAAVAAATNGVAGTNALNNYTLLTVFTAGTNTVATNAYAQLIATNAANVAALAVQNSNLLAAIAASSNLLASTKQPASLTLSNLSATGAFTNILAAGTNIVLTTNFSGNTVFINVPLQTSLTNGLAQWNGLQPTNFLATSVLPGLTNGFITSAGLATYASTSYVNSAISALNAQTNGLAAGTNVVLTTNFSGTFTYVNAATQTFLTNGLAGTNFVTAAVAAATNGLVTLAQLVATNTANLITTTQLVVAATNGGNIVFTNNPIWTNLAANGFNYVASSNGTATFLDVQGGLIVGTKTNILNWTNSIGIGANGSGMAGTYLGAPLATVWTNVFNATNTVLYSGGNYYLQSNGVSMYQSTNVITWTLVNGSLPLPLGWFGAKLRFSGDIIDGVLSSTNLTWQITNYAVSLPQLTNAIYGATNGNVGTNFILTGFVGSWTTNNQLSAAGTNAVNTLAYAQAVLVLTNYSGPTNGTTTTQVTNIANYLIAQTNLAQLGFITNRGAVTWSTVTNQSGADRPATIHWYISNNIPQYGILFTN